MNTNFFNQIAQLDFVGTLQLNIAKGTENNLIVSVLLNNEGCGDSAKNLIPPLTFNATAQEFDEDFFKQITAPVQKVSGLLVDMEQFQKQLDAVKMQSAIEKDKTEKAKKEKEAKDKKYKDGMAKVDALDKEGKHREAWMKLPDITEFPEKADEIRKRRTALSDKFSSPSLFGAFEEQALEEPPTAQQKEAGYGQQVDALYSEPEEAYLEDEEEADY